MDKKILQLLEDLKRLMILQLIQNKVQGKNIAAVLGVDPAIVSRIVSGKQTKKK